MREFQAPEIVAFLQAIAGQLKRPCRIEVIGGAAIALVYRPEHATAAIDLFSEEKGFWEAYQRARAVATHPIPVQHAGIADVPADYELRLQPLELPRLRKLAIWVPEAHDLVIMKAVRCYENDLQGIEDVHHSRPLDVSTLVERYEETYGHVIGGAKKFRFNFLVIVERLWGERARKELDTRLPPPR